MAVQIVSFERAALLLKDEVAYGTDSVPDGTNDAMFISNGRIRYDGNKVVREADRPYFGAKPFLMTGRKATVEFDFEMTPGAAADDPAPCSPILLAGAHDETIVVATSAAYGPISSAFSSESGYFYIPSGDALGARQHIVLGLRGSISWNQQINGFCKGTAKLEGREAVLSNAAFPTLALSNWQDPDLITEGSWLVQVTPDGGGAHAVDAVELQLDSNVRTQLYETSEQIYADVVGRDSNGYLRIMSPALADFDPYTLAKNATKCLIESTITGAARTQKLTLGQVQFEFPENIDIDGAAGLRIPFSAIPSDAGNDEYGWLHT